MARPRRDDYEPGSAGQKKYDDDDFKAQMQEAKEKSAKGQGANQGPTEAHSAYWKDGVRHDAVEGSAVAPIDSKINKGSLGELAAERKRRQSAQAEALR